MKDNAYFMELAIREAQKSLDEGGLPIGSVLVKDGEVISQGHNRLIQNDSVILHAEMDAIENAGRLNYEDYRKCTLYTTLSENATIENTPAAFICHGGGLFY